MDTDNIFLAILDIIYLFLYFGGILLLRIKFIKWHKVIVLRYLFIALYISSFGLVIWLDNLVIQDKLNPCLIDIEDCKEVAYIYLVSTVIHILIFFAHIFFYEEYMYLLAVIIHILMFFAHIFFYSSIPAKRYLSKNLSEKSAITWIKFKKIIFILMFVIPIIYMIIANITLTP